MFDFFVTFLIGVSITNIVVNSTVLSTLRENLSEKSEYIDLLISCMMCTGFWVGILIGLFDGFNILQWSFIISLGSFTYGKILDLIEVKTHFYISKRDLAVKMLQAQNVVDDNLSEIDKEM